MKKVMKKIYWFLGLIYICDVFPKTEFNKMEKRFKKELANDIGKDSIIVKWWHNIFAVLKAVSVLVFGILLWPISALVDVSNVVERENEKR